MKTRIAILGASVVLATMLASVAMASDVELVIAEEIQPIELVLAPEAIAHETLRLGVLSEPLNILILTLGLVLLVFIPKTKDDPHIFARFRAARNTIRNFLNRLNKYVVYEEVGWPKAA